VHAAHAGHHEAHDALEHRHGFLHTAHAALQKTHALAEAQQQTLDVFGNLQCVAFANTIIMILYTHA
jgi:hypothetical protein